MTKDDILREFRDVNFFYNDCCKYDTLSKMLDELTDNYRECRRWIPVSERLPENSDYCLCCDKDGYITIGFIPEWSKEWIFDDDEIYIDVIAWMPLPEPYKPQEEEAELVAESEGQDSMTYGDIYDDFCKKFPNAEVEDYRPATELYVPQLSRDIPNAIVVWLKDGSKVIYMAESEEA